MLLHDSPAAKIKTDTFTKSIVFAAGESCNSTGSLAFFSRRATAGHRRSPTADGDISTPRPRTGTGPPRRKVCHPGSPRSSRSHPRSCKSPETATDGRSQIRAILAPSYVNGLLRPGACKNRANFEIGTMAAFGGNCSYGGGTWTTVAIRGDGPSAVVVRCPSVAVVLRYRRRQLATGVQRRSRHGGGYIASAIA